MLQVNSQLLSYSLILENVQIIVPVQISHSDPSSKLHFPGISECSPLFTCNIMNDKFVTTISFEQYIFQWSDISVT